MTSHGRSRVVITHLLHWPGLFKKTRRWPLANSATTKGDYRHTWTFPRGQFSQSSRRFALCPELSIIRNKSAAEREPRRSDTSSDINMPSTSPPPHKRKLSQPEVNASTEVKKPKLTESNINTLPLKTATRGEDSLKGNEIPGGDLKPPKKTADKKVTTIAPTKQGPSGASNPSNASEEFPNGHLYCHQCNKKRDASRECHFFPDLSTCVLTAIPQRLSVARNLRGNARQSIVNHVSAIAMARISRGSRRPHQAVAGRPRCLTPSSLSFQSNSTSPTAIFR